jgi:hypothetical protein
LVFEKLTNWPDWMTSNDGPSAADCFGAVLGSDAPPAGAGVTPRQVLGPAASYPPAIDSRLSRSLPSLITRNAPIAVIRASAT